ncbi:MAG: DUF1987 domain-containing protein [Cyclobacteriaceae bacterium]
MDSLQIPATATTPEIQLDQQTGHLAVRGISDEEDALGFYFPVLQWMDTYVQNPADNTVLDIQLKYFNTASAKALFELIKRLKTAQKTGKLVEVNWFYNAKDPVLKEDIEQFRDLLSVPINVTPS